MDIRLINDKLAALRSMTVTPLSTIDGWQMRSCDHKDPEKYRFDGPWRKTRIPVTTGAGKTIFFRTRLRVPPAARGASFQFGIDRLECQLFIDGKPYAGIDAYHLDIAIPRTGEMELTLECLSVPGLFCRPEQASLHGQFSGASIVRIDPDIEKFCVAVQYAQDTVNICSDERRKQLLERTIEDALIAIDLTLPRTAFLDEVRKAQRIFDRSLATIAPDPESGRLYGIGHAHIDTAWLWPIRETIRKCGRTFSTACRMLEKYPNYYFSCSQPQLYAYTKKYYPHTYREIKKWVKAGRWGTDGAMWIEADCNVTAGESLIRQILYGLDFFKREFGTRTRICWLPDVFGYNASLPQLLRGCGIEYFYTYKLHWQARNFFPHSTFRWRGLDGSEILAHIPRTWGAYNGTPNPYEMSKAWEWHQQKREYPEVLFPYGYGDGGGGPNDAVLQQLDLARKHFPGNPALRTGTVTRFFKDIEKANPDLPVWDGELYLETHRGTSTTQGRMKRANRRSELALRDAEVFVSLARLGGRSIDTRPLRAAWETTCLHQFHDILPGSSIGMVYDEALRDHAVVQTTAAAVSEKALRALGPSKANNNALTVFNSLGWTRRDAVVAETPAQGIRSVIDADGMRHPVQQVSRTKGKSVIVFDGVHVPAAGVGTLGLSRKAAEEPIQLSVATNRIETALYRIRLSADGGIKSIYDKTSRREVIAKGRTGNDLQLFQDGPEHEDAWNIHATYERRRYAFEGKTTVNVIESGPVRGVIRVTRKHRKTTIEQDIIVYAHTPRIDFVTHADWHEKQVMLKVAFPVAIRTKRATYEVPFGAVERPTHRNTSWDEEMYEVAAQRWADLSEAGYGVSLLNDCKYGHDTHENVLRLTLLRGTTWPDPKADEGQHEFTYSLYPHAGNWTDAETARRAMELNIATRSKPGGGEPAARTMVDIDGPAMLEALKPAEDGKGTILRVYEPHGSRGPVRIRFAAEIARVSECNLVEEGRESVAVRNGSFRFEIEPFQIRTFRIS
jgi:alpha-mannosidase